MGGGEGQDSTHQLNEHRKGVLENLMPRGIFTQLSGPIFSGDFCEMEGSRKLIPPTGRRLLGLLLPVVAAEAVFSLEVPAVCLCLSINCATLSFLVANLAGIQSLVQLFSRHLQIPFHRQGLH